MISKGLLSRSVRYLTTSTHPTSQKGFDNVASMYEKGRPSYAKAATDLLLNIKPNSHLLEIASGSGKFTSILQDYFPKSNLTCVEPVPKFRELLTQKFCQNPEQNVRILEGSALDVVKLCGKKSMDAIFTAQAFHWFANNQTLEHFSQVLRQNGYLYIIWNNQVFNTPFLEAIGKLIDDVQLQESKEQGTPLFRAMLDEIGTLFNGNKYFNDCKYTIFNNSFAVKNEKERKEFEDYIKELIVKHYGTLEAQNIELPYDCYVIMTQCKV